MSGVFLQTYECFNLQPVPQQAYSPGCKLHIPTQLWKLVIAKVMQYSQEKKIKFHWMVHGGKAWKHQTRLPAGCHNHILWRYLHVQDS